MKTVAALSAFGLLIAAPVLAQSSGNFAAALNTTQCLIDNSSGSLGGGIVGSTFLETTLKTPNASSTALMIRPSLVTGLYTKTKVDETTTTATAWAGLQVRVSIDGNVVAPGSPVGSSSPTDGWVFYDKRWQQINQNFLGLIAACALDPLVNCSLDLIQATLSAHSMDFVAGNVGGGTHTLRVDWRFQDSDGAGGNAAACVGPAVLTVTQTKTFSTGGGIVINP